MWALVLVCSRLWEHQTPLCIVWNANGCLNSLHWLKINERIEYKLISLNLQSSYNQPTWLPTQSYLCSVYNSLLVSCHPSSTFRIFLIKNQKPLLVFHIGITLPLESAPFFIPSTSFCSLSSWFTSSYGYHLIAVITFVLTIYHFLDLSLQI